LQRKKNNRKNREQYFSHGVMIQMIGYLRRLRSIPRIQAKINAFTQEKAAMINVKIFQFNPLQENTYLLYNEDGDCIVVDPGCYTDKERDQLRGFIEAKQLNPIMLINTHCHLDHVFGNKFVHETYGLELHIHEGEKQVLEMAPTSGLMWNLPFDNYSGPIHFLDEGSILMLGDETIQVLLTPGHSPASISFYASKSGFVMAGDVLFRESVGRTDLPGGSPAVLVKSILEKLYCLPDPTIVYSGHGIPTTIGHEKVHNPYVSA
jgi:glyoxylase-like metal-dependent hydrolase (beta-lactamase superfamily II)